MAKEIKPVVGFDESFGLLDIRVGRVIEVERDFFEVVFRVPDFDVFNLFNIIDGPDPRFFDPTAKIGRITGRRVPEI